MLDRERFKTMRKTLLIAALILVGAFCFTACNDDETGGETTELTTAEKMQHRWNLDCIKDITYKGSTTDLDYIDTVVSGAGDYIEFKGDNKAYMKIDGDMDTVAYDIVNDQTFNFDGDVFTISTLTSSQFEAVYKERVDTPYFDNVVKMSR